MSRRRILIQLDTDRHASAFDRVVAVDAGVDHLFSYAAVEPTDVQGLVHGAMFTRGPEDLKSTAIFVGGGNCEKAEALFAVVRKTFFGPLRTSVLLDPNGANTTAAAIVLCALKHVEAASSTALVLGGTGPVGTRVALLLARVGMNVRLASRDIVRAEACCQKIAARLNASGSANPSVRPVSTETIASGDSLDGNLAVVVAAGAAGVRLLDRDWLVKTGKVKVAIDANAVPPEGIEGVGATDKAKSVDGIVQYGALGVGGYKMKIHKAALNELFQSNDRILDAESIYDFAGTLGLV